MVARIATRMLLTTDKRALWKFAYNFGYKGMRSVQKFKKRLKQGEHFPPFLFISIINSCQLRCQGCWVDVASPRQMISLEDLDKLVTDAKQRGNSYFGLLGGEPFMHPGLMELLERHPDCYFQVFTNGQLITDEVAKKLRKLGNVTPLISIEGSEIVSDERRGGRDVLNKTMEGVKNCVRNKLIVGVASSICQTNYDLVSKAWLDRLIELGVHYVWFHAYRVVGPSPTPELALTPEQLLNLRRFIVDMRTKAAIGIVEPYWDDRGEALCPMATGVSHHIGPSGAIEPCPIIQFAKETIHDGPDVYDIMTKSEFLDDFRRTSAEATRGCVVLERPDLVRDLVNRHSAGDTTQRGTALAELDKLEPRVSQHNPEHVVPEKQWLYRFAKKYWFFGFGAYT